MGFRTKTIKKVIDDKINDWLMSIEDKNVLALAQKGTIVTGGSIASMLLGEKVNDFDLYFKDHATALAVAKYYVERFKPETSRGIKCKIYVEDGPAIHSQLENGTWEKKIVRETYDEVAALEGDDEGATVISKVPKPEPNRIRVVIKSAGIASEAGTEEPYSYFEGRPDEVSQTYVGAVMNPGEIEDMHSEIEDAALETTDEDGKPKYRPIFMSSNAITLSNRVQLILRFYGNPETIHTNYDFVHCTNYWQSWGIGANVSGGDLTLRKEALECLLAKELRYVGSKYPVCSIIRLRKFIGRGWKINAGQMLKMMMQISDLDLHDPKVLEDQLTGVDAAYFIQLMQKLNEKDPGKINSAYLIEIIDRMF